MADGDNAKIFKVLCRKSRDKVSGDGVLAECRLILAKTLRPQPVRDVHRPPRRAIDMSDQHCLTGPTCPGDPLRQPNGRFGSTVADQLAEANVRFGVLRATNSPFRYRPDAPHPVTAPRSR